VEIKLKEEMGVETTFLNFKKKLVISNFCTNSKILYCRDKALKEEIKNPRFFSIATLTGHAELAYG
jgi:hypothetical protein